MNGAVPKRSLNFKTPKNVKCAESIAVDKKPVWKLNFQTGFLFWPLLEPARQFMSNYPA